MTGQSKFLEQSDKSSFIVKGTMEPAQNLAKGPDGPRQPLKIHDKTWDGTVQDFDSLSCPVLSCGTKQAQAGAGKEYS